jgi:hypothetical protein
LASAMGKASEIKALIHLANAFRNLTCGSTLWVIDATFEQGNVWDQSRRRGLMALKSSHALLSCSIETSKHFAEPGRKEMPASTHNIHSQLH